MLFEIRYIAPYTRDDREGLCRAVEAALSAQHFKPILGAECDVLEILDRRMLDAKASQYTQGVRADLILTRTNKIANRAGFIYVLTQPEMRMMRAAMLDMAHEIDDDHNTVVVWVTPQGQIGDRTDNAQVKGVCGSHKMTYSVGQLNKQIARLPPGIPIVERLMVIGLNVEGFMDPSWPNPMYVAVTMGYVNDVYPERLMAARMSDDSHEAKA